MKKIGLLFPGQGSQKIEMGLEFYKQNQDVQLLFSHANNILGYDLTKVCFEGPTEKLTDTRHAQPALFLVSYSIFKLLEKEGITPIMLAGHSLGELTAYAAAGVVSFESALKIIQKRADAMASSCLSDEYGMSAILGLDSQTIQTCITPFENAPVVIANLNTPQQTVISGNKKALQELQPIFKQKGGKAIPLKVSGPFHSPLMKPASESLHQFLVDQSFQDAKIPIVLNRTAQPEIKADLLKENLPKQVISAVNWTDSIKTMSTKVDMMIECGSGKVLSGLVKKICPDMPISNIGTPSELKNAIYQEVK